MGSQEGRVVLVGERRRRVRAHVEAGRRDEHLVLAVLDALRAPGERVRLVHGGRAAVLAVVLVVEPAEVLELLVGEKAAERDVAVLPEEGRDALRRLHGSGVGCQRWWGWVVTDGGGGG